jgi:hypothetical protein
MYGIRLIGHSWRGCIYRRAQIGHIPPSLAKCARALVLSHSSSFDPGAILASFRTSNC